MAKGLTKRQEEILEFIVGRVREEGFPPTLKEIAGRFGLASANAARDHVLALERKGFLKRTGEKSRALSLTRALRAAVAAPAAPRGWPLVGVVPAGTPVLAEENFEGYVDLAKPRPCSPCRRFSLTMLAPMPWWFPTCWARQPAPMRS